MEGSGRRRPHRLLPLLLGVALAAAGAVAPISPTQAGTEVAGSDTSTLTNPNGTGYGKPNQSRVWFNSAAGRWDALVPRNDGGSSASDHYVVLDVAGAPLFTGLELEDRDDARPDVVWDDAGHTLYVLGSHMWTPLFWRVVHNPATDTYSVDPLADGVEVPGVTHASENWPATVHVSPNGHVWAAVLRSGALAVQHSVDGGTTWMPAAVVLDATTHVGVTSWTHFALAGTTYVGLFAAENGDGKSDTDYFYWYLDENADPSDPGQWTDDSAAIPASVDGELSDDHVCAARDEDENQYFVAKTEGGTPVSPRIQVFKRTPDGVWSRYEVTTAEELPRQTRPSVVLDDRNDRLYVFSTNEGGGDGVRVRAPLNQLELLSSAPQFVLFHEPGAVFDDAIAPRGHVEGTSGVVVLAHNETARTVWVAAEAIVDRGPEDPSAVPDSAVVAEGATLNVPAPGVLGNDSDPQGDPIGAALVGLPAHGLLTLAPDGSYTYVHDGSETAADVFHYEAVDDGGATSDAVAVSLTVTPVNDRPVAVNDFYPFELGTPLTVAAPGLLANDTDPEGGNLTASLVSGPSSGSVQLQLDGSFVYTHNGSAETLDSFTYVAREGIAIVSDPATVTLAALTPVGSPIPGSDTSSLTSVQQAGYGKPHQSRIWYNAAAGRWDAVVPKGGAGSTSDHYLMVDVAGAPGFTGVKLEDRNSALPDVFWHAATSALFVLGSHGTDSRIWRVVYNAPGDFYAVDPGVNARSVPGISHAAGLDGLNNPATLHVSPNGHVWVAVMKDGALDVQGSADGGNTWLASPLRLDPAAALGTTSWVDFEHGGTIRVGLFASEDGDVGSSSRYRYWLIDQDADPGLAGNWTDLSASVPGPLGQEVPDNHVHATRDAEGNQYFVVKTQPAVGTDPQLLLLRRTPSGLWSRHVVTRAQDPSPQTRPSIVVDTELREIYVYSSDSGGGVGRRRKAGLDDLDALEQAAPFPVFQSLTATLDDVIVPKHGVTPATGIVLLAHAEDDLVVWRSFEPIPNDSCLRFEGGTPLLATALIPESGGTGLLSARIWRPAPASQQVACPLISMVPPAGGSLNEIAWEGDRLAQDGYVAIAVRPSAQTPAARERAVRSGIDYMLSGDNPWPSATDTERIGALGGPVASAALTLAQESDLRIDAVVEWDNLALSELGDDGSPVCSATPGPPRTPRVPAMGQASDGCVKSAGAKQTAYAWWRGAGRETMQVVFSGSSGAWWGLGGSAVQHDRVHYYTLGWFDRWLKNDASAASRLLAQEPLGTPLGTLLDDHYYSGAYFDGYDCPNLRALDVGAVEVCSSGVDENCDGLIDCQDTAACPPGTGGAPGDVGGLLFSDPNTLVWQPVSGAAVYDVLGGSLAELLSDRSFSGSECLAWRLPDTTFTVADEPPGAVSYFLVRAKADPCLLGTWGSAIADQTSNACP